MCIGTSRHGTCWGKEGLDMLDFSMPGPMLQWERDLVAAYEPHFFKKSMQAELSVHIYGEK